MKNQLFEPDNNKLKFTIEIQVFENCSVLGIKGEYAPNYYELTGVLQAQLLHIVFTQRQLNMKLPKKKSK